MANEYFDPRRVVEIARAELGYREKKSAKDLDDKTANAGDKNFTKYARDIDNIKGFLNGSKQGICGWCSLFVIWCFIQAYGVTEGRELLCLPLKSCGAGPYWDLQYFKAKKRLESVPEPGDQIFFYPSSGEGKVSHTGLVVDVDGKYVYTIEGNTAANGITGCVAEHKYMLTNSRIAGYGRPDWGEAPEEVPAEDTGEDPDVETDADPGLDWDGVVVYAGPGEWYEPLGTVAGEPDVIAIALNGWVAVEYKNYIAWVDPEDVRVVARAEVASDE